ncbi:Arsenical pump membrane protein [Rutstroemia sp. NJR-2017a WRK4]|nr:Arsenical pump membrane protein [Rutstroemia sp. NJR-2017a WRK4]
MSTEDLEDLDTSKIKNWRSIVTLLVFIITNIIVLFPFHIPVYIPRPLVHGIRDTLSTLRILSPRRHLHKVGENGRAKPFVRFWFPMNFVTAPLIADLFLLAILAIGRKEVHDGTIGADHISPIDIMVFFITLAYIAISIDASGLIRYLAFKVLQKGGKVGHRLFFFLYVFFFALGSFIGNDPIILSGTAFLAYMTRVSSNIIHPRAWIHTQFAIANISSAILVSSNPTNLVLAGAFGIKFIVYTANMIVPVVVTAIVLFPFLLYIVFADESLIPYSIKMHELSEEAKAKKPVNPNIPNARGNAQEEEKKLAEDKLLSLEEIMNPFLDKGGAAFGAVIMAATLVTLLAINAASQSEGDHPVYWVTLPAAFVMFCWEVSFGWFRRHETREIARKGRREIELAQERREEEMREMNAQSELKETGAGTSRGRVESHGGIGVEDGESNSGFDSNNLTTIPTIVVAGEDDRSITISTPMSEPHLAKSSTSINEKQETTSAERATSSEVDERAPPTNPPHDIAPQNEDNRATLVSLLADTYRWCQETFPTVTAVIAHLPFALVPFAFSMFVLVQALVTKGWVPVFAYGWDHWVTKTGTVGAIGGMGFLSVILCNFAGTNIGTTILLCRVIQNWIAIHEQNHIPITQRTFWATVYSMAIGVNYGAFSTAFSASLAGLLWRDILARKYIYVRRLDFARVNLPIIAIAMVVGCAVLVGQVYIVKSNEPYVRTR